MAPAPEADPDAVPDPAAELVLDPEVAPEGEVAPDAGPDPNSARCTGSSPVAPPVVALGAGPGRGADRCTGEGVPDAVSLPERGRAGPSPALGRRAAARWTGGPGVVDRCSVEGAEEVRGVGAGPGDGALASCAGDDVPRSCAGAGAGGVVGPGSRAARCTGVPLARAGVVVGRAGGVGVGPLPGSRAARCTGAGGDDVPRSCAGAGGVVGPVSRTVRCTGAGGDDVPRSCADAGGVVGPVSRAARCTGVPLSRAGVVLGRAGGVGVGPPPDSRAARCTGVLDEGVLGEGVLDDGVPDDGVRDDVPPSRAGVVSPPERGSDRRTGMSEGGRVPESASGAGVFAPGAAAVRADAARCTGGSAGAGEPADGGCCRVPAVRCAGAPGPARSPSVDGGAVREDDGGVSAVRRLAGRDRRCTADAPDGAFVRACRGRGAAGGTGVTRTPRADWAGVFDGVAAVADGAGAGPAARAARWTGGVAVDAVDGVGPGADAAPRAPPRLPPGAAPAADVRVAGTGAAGAPGAASSAGIARRGATGIRCTGGGPGGGARGVDEG
ncbi:hypothetical protein [Streptomyces sp. NPDC021969]|uniref:hypothetical protein n=1 Tax=unclassified Streptomyces TaxID=2593676 RepID=UPI0033F91C7B